MRLELPSPGSPEDWLRYARSDLALAGAGVRAEVLVESLCYHAQQAAEKSLKAVLVHYGQVPPRTHSLTTLADALSSTRRIPPEIQDAAALTAYAVMARYPIEHEPITEAEYREALRLAAAVVTWAEEAIRGTDADATTL